MTKTPVNRDLNSLIPAPKRKRGRPPGSKNKPKDYKSFLNAREACARMELDPFKVLADIAKNSEDESLRRLAAKDLCEYLEPKLRRLDVTPNTQPSTIKIVWGGGEDSDPVMAMSKSKVIEHQD